MRLLPIFFVMIRPKLVLLVTLLTLMRLSPLAAQEESAMSEEPMILEALNIDDGLSQNFVTAILQDHRGFMWFGTRDGLNKYDGYRFTIYRHDPYDFTSISFNWISIIYEDKAHRLWIGTYDGGLNLFDRETERFQRFMHDPVHANSLSDSRITAIAEGPEGEMWIGTQAGLNKLLLDKNKSQYSTTITRYTHNPGDAGSLNHNYITAIVADSGGTVWIGTPAGLHKLDAKAGIVLAKYAEGPAGPLQVKALYQDQNGALWIVGNYAVIIRFEPSTERMIVYFGGDKDAGDFAFNIFASRSLSSHLGGRRLWLMTGGAMIAFDPATGAFKKFLTQLKVQIRRERDYAISAAYEDRSGLLWVGTNGRGLGKYAPVKQRFENPLARVRDSQELENASIRSLYQDRSGAIWIGTTGGRIYHLNPSTGQVYREDGLIPYAMLEDRQGSFWVGGGAFLFKYVSNPAKSGTVRSLLNLRPEIDLREFCGSLYEDREGRVWFQQGNALAQFDPATKRISEFPTPFSMAPDAYLSSGVITSIKQDGAGIFWLGSNIGLLRFDPKTKAWKQYRNQPGNSNSLSYDHIWSLHLASRDSGKTIWIGTAGGGLNRFDPATETFTHYTEKDGLPNNVVYAILEDRAGNLWMSTNKGLSRFTLSAVEGSAVEGQNAFRNFDVRDGLQSNEFNSFAYHQAADGKMFFGGINGVNAFYPEKITDNEHVPPIVFTDFLLAQNPVSFKTPNSPLEKPIAETEAITLSYRNNIFALEFAALDFAAPPKNRYAYKMENFQEEWIEAGAQRVATFTNLDPGEYVFRVKAANNDGVWNEEGAAIKITIMPPWWRTTLAYMIYGLLLAAGVFAVDRLQRRRVIQRERAKSQLREAELVRQQAEELETMDNIVKTINREVVLENVLHALLEQGMKLFPQAEKAFALIHDARKKHFIVAASIGYDAALLQDKYFSLQEIAERYAARSEEVEKGIYVMRHLQKATGSQQLQTIHKPESFLAMAVAVEGTLEGYLAFDSYTHANAFDRPDARTLNRLRSHATSAIAKAKTLRELEEKNAEIIRAQEQLVTQQKLASLGQLTAGIAHEIKNPLNFVNNFAALSVDLAKELREELEGRKAKGDGRDDFANIEAIIDTLVQNAEKINHHGKRVDGIVKSMMQHARGSSGQREMVDINHLLDEAVNLVYHGMRANDASFNVTIEKEYDASVGKLEVVPQDLSRVFLNIVNNACYAAFQKQKANSKEQTANFSPTLSVRTKNLGDKIEIRIRDNGSGIPPEVRDKIFNPFFTTKPTGQGTGLGLSISYDIIVQQHRGEIKVETEEGQFTEFMVGLPKE